MKTPASFIAGMAAGIALMSAATWMPLAVSAARAETAAVQATAKSRVVLENDRVRVKDVIFPAGATRTGQHTHELAHVGVILTSGALVFTEDSKSETVKFAAGDVGFREANATHDVGNPGRQDMRVIEVELK